MKLVLIALAYGHLGWKSLATHAYEPHHRLPCDSSLHEQQPAEALLGPQRPHHLMCFLPIILRWAPLPYRVDSRFFDAIACGVLSETALTHIPWLHCPPQPPLQPGGLPVAHSDPETEAVAAESWCTSSRPLLC